MKNLSQDCITHSIVWRNPSTSPPDNLPRTLFEVSNTNNIRCTRDLPEYPIINSILRYFRRRKIYGWSIGFSVETINEKPRKQWSNEAKARNRRNRLLKRLKRKYSIPQLLESEYNRVINQNPGYYLIDK